MTGPTPSNRKGQFENNTIRDSVVKPYLRTMGLDPLCQDPLPDPKRLLSYPDLRTDVKNALMEDGYKEGPWFYKGAKMCLLWPLWHEAFPNAKWIIVRRKAEDIAKSCIRTPFMRAFKTVGGWLEWAKVHEERFEEMKAAGLDITEVQSEHLIQGRLYDIRNLVESVEGLTWREDKIRDFITPELWKGGKV